VVQRIGKSDTAHHLLSFSGMVAMPAERRNCGLPGDAAPGPRYDAVGDALGAMLGAMLGDALGSLLGDALGDALGSGA
jgi:hypothetical protein